MDKVKQAVDGRVADQMPEALFEICYDQVCDDFIGLIECMASFGELDRTDSLTLEAYRQGGWPCGASGPRPTREACGFELFLDGSVFILGESHA